TSKGRIGRDADIGVCESPWLHPGNAAIPVRGAVDVTELMLVVPTGVMAGMVGACVTPCAVMRSCRSRRSRFGNRRGTQGQCNKTKRPAKRNHAKHIQSSVDTPVPLRSRERRTLIGVLRIGLWREQDFFEFSCGSAGTFSGSFGDHFVTKNNRCCRIAATSINCDFLASRRSVFKRSGHRFA